MPTSASTFDVLAARIIQASGCCRYLDIGAGAGKYGVMIRKVCSDAYVEAVEQDASYVKQFNLLALYDKVMVMDAAQIPHLWSVYATDMVILGDVLEHFTKSQGLDLLHWLVYRCKLILAVLPDKYVQFDHLHPQEAHRSVWSPVDFTCGELLLHKQEGRKHLYVVRGFLADAGSIVPEAEMKVLKGLGIELGLDASFEKAIKGF